MTVILSTPYASFPAGATTDFDNATEAALVAQGRAAYTFNPGTAFLPLTAAEQQLVRDGHASWGGQPYAWANRPSAATAGIGAEIVVTDLGTLGHTRWRSDGTTWRPSTPFDIIFDTTPSANTSSTTEGLLKQYTIPAGLLSSVRWFAVKSLYSKSGAAETATFRVRLGTAGTTADQAILTNSSTLSGTNRAATVEGSFFASSATQLRGVGRDSGFGVGGFSAGATTTTYPTNFTIPNMDSNALILTLTMAMSVGAETGSVAHVILSLA